MRGGRGRPEPHIVEDGERLEGRTVVLSGGTTGISMAVASAAVRHGANVVILARTAADADPDRPAIQVVAAGGRVVLVVDGDIRSEDDVQATVDFAVSEYGGVDACINIASALCLTGTEALTTATFDLMHQVNVRGAFLLTRACIPHLRRSDQAHILTISPPLNMSERWLGAHPGYTASKYGMTILGLGWAAELAADGIASNCLWPHSTIANPGVLTLLAGDRAVRARRPDIVGDAAMEIIARPPDLVTGRCFLDVEVLGAAGVTDLRAYGGGEPPDLDLFVDA